MMTSIRIILDHGDKPINTTSDSFKLEKQWGPPVARRVVDALDNSAVLTSAAVATFAASHPTTYGRLLALAQQRQADEELARRRQALEEGK